MRMRFLLTRTSKFSWICVVIVVCILSSCALVSLDRAREPSYQRNVILMIGDGYGFSHFEIARSVKQLVENEPLAQVSVMSHGNTGYMSTPPENGLVTDSAAAGTALATGNKTENGVLSQSPNGKPYKTALELAKEHGMATGLVSTSYIADATPAAFAAHSSARSRYADIAAQELLVTGVDVMLGGGREDFIPQSAPGSRRKDSRDLLAEAQAAGYTLVSTSSDLSRIDPARVPRLLGLFSLHFMAYEIDRPTTQEPSLALMTQKALDILQLRPQGFFLMVESGRIDHAAHANDAATMVRDALAFDDAIRIAYQFAQQHPETLLIVTADHETGGVALNYGATPDQLLLLMKQQCSVDVMLKEIGSPATAAALQSTVRRHTPFSLSDDELEHILAQKSPTPFLSDRTSNLLADVLSARYNIGWMSRDHTSEPLFVFGIGPGAEQLRGFHDNTDIGKIMISFLQAN
jgi:alkaline phosphatase